jgi:hypothetical protein
MRADPERQAQAAHKRAIVYTPERHAEAARKRAATMGHEAMSAMAIIAAAKQSAKALSARARKGKASMGAERRRKAALKGSEARTHEQRSLSAQQAVKTVGHDGCVARAIKGHATRRAKTGMPAGIQLRADGYFAVFALKSDYGKSIYIGYCKTIEDAIATQKQFYLDHPASSSSDDHPKKRKFVD